MAHFDLYFFCMTLAGFVLSAWHLCWAGCHPNSVRGQWANRLGVCALLVLGSGGLLAAGIRSSWLVPMGLMAGLLIVLMLWESPEPTWSSKEI